MKILLKNGSIKGEKVLDILIENDKIIKICTNFGRSYLSGPVMLSSSLCACSE